MGASIIGGLTQSVDLVSVAELQQKVSTPGSINSGGATEVVGNDSGLAQGSVTREAIEQSLAVQSSVGAKLDFRA